MKHIGTLALAAVICTGLSARQADAGGGCYGYGWYGMYSTYSREYIPYFSQHPPVYYSYPVPRPYGWSPYAYPPGTLTPEFQFEPAPEPVTIHNPFVKPEQAEESTAAADNRKEGRSLALRVTNPYVNQPAERATAKLAKVRYGR